MADLFTRLVGGPAASLTPRVPAPHEPSYVDEIEVEVPAGRALLEPLSQALLSQALLSQAAQQVAEAAGARRHEEAAAPRGEVLPIRGVPGEVAVREVAAREVPGEVAVRDARGEAAPQESRDLGALLSPQRQEPAKIPQGLRPREVIEREPVRERTPARQTEAAQTVRISIGRIEIRAPQPPAPAPPPPAPVQPQAPQGPQALSLADYLRGNDGRPR